MSLTSSQTWPSQMNVRRPSSRSPNVAERTPIRHGRMSIPRARSTSGSDALLAYATEQTLQQQQQQQQQQTSMTTTTPLLQQTTPISTPPLFSTQAFSTLSPASPFLQQNYYDHSTSGFSDLPNQPVGHGMSDFYSMARGDLHGSPMNTASLNAQEALYMQQTNQARRQQQHQQQQQQQLPSMNAQALNFPPISRPLESTPGNVEVSSSRNKPQCWDHGCNGRQFSTFSNLLRHQREKSGTAAKARCPHCGTEFTRTTARNGHMYGGKCKGMPDASKRSSIAESADNSE